MNFGNLFENYEKFETSRVTTHLENKGEPKTFKERKVFHPLQTYRIRKSFSELFQPSNMFNFY